MLAAGRGKRALFVAQRTLRRKGRSDGRGHDVFSVISGGFFDFDAVSGKIRRREAFLQTPVAPSAMLVAMNVAMNVGSQTRPEMEKHGFAP
jgi:hypothetical protein